MYYQMCLVIFGHGKHSFTRRHLNSPGCFTHEFLTYMQWLSCSRARDMLVNLLLFELLGCSAHILLTQTCQIVIFGYGRYLLTQSKYTIKRENLIEQNLYWYRLRASLKPCLSKPSLEKKIQVKERVHRTCILLINCSTFWDEWRSMFAA